MNSRVQVDEDERTDEGVQIGTLNGLFVLGRSIGFIGEDSSSPRLASDTNSYTVQLTTSTRSVSNSLSTVTLPYVPPPSSVHFTCPY